jgi:hypothetical protein
VHRLGQNSGSVFRDLIVDELARRKKDGVKAGKMEKRVELLVKRQGIRFILKIKQCLSFQDVAAG